MLIGAMLLLVGCVQSNFDQIDADEVGHLIDGQRQTQDESELEVISADELALRNSQSECWVAYQGIVYDVTTFLSQHPGGANAIIPHCGTAEQFETAFSNQHGQRQIEVLRQQGEVVGSFE